MILRRVAGFSIWMLLLQLNFASGDLACAQHDADSTEVASHATLGQQEMAETGDHDHPPAGESESCDIPAQSDCCPAALSCAMTLGFAAHGQPADVPVAHLAVAPLSAQAPAYLIQPPEPPPPKV